MFLGVICFEFRNRLIKQLPWLQYKIMIMIFDFEVAEGMNCMKLKMSSKIDRVFNCL